MSKLPFVPRIFWTVFAIVAVLVILVFIILVRFASYHRTTTDTVGAAISAIIFSYLVHLWVLPGDHPYDDEEDDVAGKN